MWFQNFGVRVVLEIKILRIISVSTVVFSVINERV